MSKPTNQLSQVGTSSTMEAIRKKLQSCVPDPYILEWDGRPQVPIRYKISTIPEKVESYNILWAEAITKRTGRRYEEENENYLKFCIPYEESTVYISLFQRTGTVMFQGNKSPYWADHNLLNICKDVKTDKKGYLRLNNCTVCKEKGTNDMMIVCDDEDCDKWTHHSCVSITDEASRKLTFQCKACSNNQSEKLPMKKYQNVTSTPLAKEPGEEEKSRHSSTDSSLSSVSEIHISSSKSNINYLNSEDSSLISEKENSANTSKIKYLKGLENKFKELAQDDSGNNESPSINGIKDIIQKVRESIAEELSLTSILISNSFENDISNDNLGLSKGETPDIPTASNQVEDHSKTNTTSKEKFRNPVQSLYSSLPYAHRETNAILEQNIQILKEENTIKSIEIDGLKEKIKSLENLLELKNTPPTKERHRLEYRDTKSIINEYKLLEDRNKMLNQQLCEAQKEKLCYKKNLAVLKVENEELKKEQVQAKQHQKPSQAPQPPIRYNKISKLKETINGLEEQMKIYENVKEELETEISNKDLQISNLQQQIDIDENVKQNLNDLLEIAYSDIKELRDKVHDTTFIIPNEDGLHKIPWSEEQIDTTYTEEHLETTYAEILKKQNQYDRLVNNELDSNEPPNLLQNKNHQTCPPIQPLNEQIRQKNHHNEWLRRSQYNGQNHRYQNIYSEAEKRRQREKEYERTKNRPICPWYLENKCYSNVCVYKHPPKPTNESKISLDDVSSTTSNDNGEICKYHLEGRCWFGVQCRNIHENKN